MNDINFDYQQIVEGKGFEIAFAGMAIVFFALTVVSLFIAFSPHLLRIIDRLLPPVVHAHSTSIHKISSPTSVQISNDESADEIAAVIGYILHTRHQK